MTARNYATFDPAWLGPDLVLEQSGTVVTFDTIGSNARNARSLYGKTRGLWYAEFMLYGEGVLGEDNQVSIGVVNEDASSSECVGDSADSYGYRSDGDLRTGNATSANVASLAIGDTIGVLVDIDAATVTWMRNGEPLGVIALTGQHEWRLAVTVSDETTAFGFYVMMNTGQREFTHKPTTTAGWYDGIESFGMLRLADTPYISAGNATPDNTRYEGLISAQSSSLVLTQSLSFWPWGSTGSARGKATLRIDNATGYGDTLVSGDARDSVATLIDPVTGDIIGKWLVDSAQASSDGSMQVNMRDVMAKTHVALQRRLFPPTVDEGAANTQWPIVIGAVYSAEPPLISSPNRIYAINDGPMAAVGAVRDKGDPLDFSLLDYTRDDAKGTIQLTTEAYGRLTLDLSSVGGDDAIEPTDLLDGDGDFTDSAKWCADASLTPSTIGGPGAGNSSITGGVLTLGDSTNWQTQQSQMLMSYVKNISLVLTKGKLYKIVIKATHLKANPTNPYDPNDPNNAPAQLVVAPGNSSGVMTENFSWLSIPAPEDASGQFLPGGAEQTFIAWANPSYDTAFWIGLRGSAGGDQAKVTDVKVYESSDSDYTAGELLPISLEAYMREVLENRAGWTSRQWSWADAYIIDSYNDGGTAYAGIGLWADSKSNMSVYDALQLAAEAYCASLWVDDQGVLRITRLRAPEDSPPWMIAQGPTIGIDDMLTEPTVTVDTAPALTTQMGARKNWSVLTATDLVTDGIPLPAGGNPINPALGITGDIELQDDGWTWKLGANVVSDALDPDLTAIAAIATTGYLKRIGADTWATASAIPQTDVTGLTAALAAKLDDSQASAFGLTLLDDANASAARTTLGLGTAATAATGDFATAAQGALADTATQPGDLATVATSGSASHLVTGEVPDQRLPNRLQEIAAIPATSWDEATENGFYWGLGKANAPVTGYLRVIAHNMLSGSYVSQRAWVYNASSDYYWQREKAGTWGAWEKWIGLDAPADGKYYLRHNNTWVDAATVFLKLSGGTLSGTLVGTVIEADTVRDKG